MIIGAIFMIAYGCMVLSMVYALWKIVDAIF
jgi:hypothetical protein